MPKLTIEQTIQGYFSNPDLSDVCFLVGDERKKVYAHRFILAAGSEVFKAMFYGQLKETTYEINVPDLLPIGFDNLIKYFYTKKVEINLSGVQATYMAANKYMALDLIQDLTDHIIKNCSNKSDVCLAYDQLLKFGIGDSLSDAKNRIAAEFSAACASDHFKQIDKDTLISILKFSKLNIREIELLKGCMRWADNEVARQNLSAADKASKRKAFEPIKHLIRFGDITLGDLSSIPDLGDFLTVEEVGSIFMQLSYQYSSPLIEYRSPRGSRNSNWSIVFFFFVLILAVLLLIDVVNYCAAFNL